MRLLSVRSLLWLTLAVAIACSLVLAMLQAIPSEWPSHYEAANEWFESRTDDGCHVFIIFPGDGKSYMISNCVLKVSGGNVETVAKLSSGFFVFPPGIEVSSLREGIEIIKRQQ